MSLKICIVGLDDYPLLAGREEGEFSGGGEAVQHALLARAWRDLGVEVTVIVRDHGQPPDLRVDGIRLLAAFREQAGLRGLRFLHPRMTGLLAALRKADADVYYQSPASAHTGITAWFCRRRRRTFVARIASDANCMPGAQLIRFARDRRLYEYGLENADLIVAQTQTQRRLLQENYGLPSVVIDMAVEEPRPAGIREDVPDTDVLWVGNIRDVKRPELALAIARRLPQLRFTMVGGPMLGRQAYYERIAAEARTLPNVTFVGAVAYADVGRYFDRTRVLLNTSSVEGFPNTFLQAWIRGVPVMSCFDPDQLIRRHRLGAQIASADEAVAVLEGWFSRENAGAPLGEFGDRAKQFATERYAAARIARRYLELLNDDHALRVIQTGPALDVRGGVATVERLILDSAGTGVRMRHLPAMEEASPLRRLRVFLNARRQLRRELKRPEPLLVHIHFASRGSTLRKLVLARMVLRARRPLVLHAHGAAFDRFFLGLPRLARRIIGRTFARADCFITLSSQWRRFYVEHCNVPEQRIVVLHNPVRLPATLPDRSGHAQVQFLFMGRIGRRKGAFDLVQAFESLPAAVRTRARLVLAGDGEVEALRRTVNAAEITVHSWVDEAQRDVLLAGSDVFVLPSQQEGVPMAVLEAMAWGLPVIVTPVGGLPDIVTDGREGLWVPPGDVAQLAASLQRLIEDESMRNELAARARRRAEQLDVRRYADKLYEIYVNAMPAVPAEKRTAWTGVDWVTPRSRG